MKIVSLLPSATELVCGLGLRDQLVGVSHECDYPASVVGLPVLTSSRIPEGQAPKKKASVLKNPSPETKSKPRKKNQAPKKKIKPRKKNQAPKKKIAEIGKTPHACIKTCKNSKNTHKYTKNSKSQKM